MKIAITALLWLLLSASSAVAVECEKTEYAELRDKGKERLVSDYCYYKKIASIRYEEAQERRPLVHKFQSIGAIDRAAKLSKEILATVESAGRCEQESLRNLDVLKKRFQLKAPPSCN